MNQNEWIIKGEVGTSSKTMWAAINGVALKGAVYHKGGMSRYDIPSDPSDFSRCLKYVELTGVTKEQLQIVKEVFPWWSPFIDNWDKIVKLFNSEIKLRAMQKTYDYIQELERQSKILAGWKETKHNQWTFSREDQ